MGMAAGRKCRPDSGVSWGAVSGDGFGGPSVNERAAGSTDWDWSRWGPSVPDAAERTTGNTVWDGSGWVTSVADVAERTTGNTDWSGSGGAASVADVAPPDDNFHGWTWFDSRNACARAERWPTWEMAKAGATASDVAAIGITNKREPPNRGIRIQ